jgi:hypothetical protein
MMSSPIDMQGSVKQTHEYREDPVKELRKKLYLGNKIYKDKNMFISGGRDIS